MVTITCINIVIRARNVNVGYLNHHKLLKYLPVYNLDKFVPVHYILTIGMKQLHLYFSQCKWPEGYSSHLVCHFVFIV